MKLYRFSPITSKEELVEAVRHIHTSCAEIVQKTFGSPLPVAGNIGVFCHYAGEYEYLSRLAGEITEPTNPMHGKYFKLIEPIAVGDVTYTHLYIRKPDPYRAQVGDADFVMEGERYKQLHAEIQMSKGPQGARVFDRPGTNMIELFDPDVDVLAYVVS